MTASTAQIGNTFPTLADVTKRLDPNGSIANIAEVLEQKNPLLQDMSWVEANMPSAHRFTSRSALPALTWRKFNQGVAPAKSTTDQHDEPIGQCVGYSKVDCALAKLNGNEAAFRASEDLAFVSAFNNELATGIFYHSYSSNPEKFQGLSPRLSATSGNPAASGGPTGTGQIIKADSGASGGDQTSIWLIGWGPETVFGIFPKGSVGGLQHVDMGEQLVPDSGGTNQFRAYVSEWTWQVGLCVKDYRYVARVCNIDTGTGGWTNDLSTGADLVARMQDAMTAIYDLNNCKPVFYMARNTFNMVGQQMMARQANYLEYVDRGGSRVPHMFGIPIRFCDALTTTEAVVS
jgi:hypothetical protein